MLKQWFPSVLHTENSRGFSKGSHVWPPLPDTLMSLVRDVTWDLGFSEALQVILVCNEVQKSLFLSYGFTLVGGASEPELPNSRQCPLGFLGIFFKCRCMSEKWQNLGQNYSCVCSSPKQSLKLPCMLQRKSPSSVWEVFSTAPKTPAELKMLWSCSLPLEQRRSPRWKQAPCQSWEGFDRQHHTAVCALWSTGYGC